MLAIYTRGFLGPGPKSAGFPGAKPLLLVPRVEIHENEREKE